MHIDRLERYWIVIVAGVMGVFFAALVAGAFVYGVRLPSSPREFINPLGLQETEFATPGLRDMGDNQYTLHIVAQMWRFDMGSSERDALGNEIVRVPVGARVSFAITSRDITHGFIIERHNANIQVLPGHIGRATVVFRNPGTYRILCHEYCGRGHQQMHAAIIVE